MSYFRPSDQNVHTTYRCERCGYVQDMFPWEHSCRNCGSKRLKLTRRFT